MIAATPSDRTMETYANMENGDANNQEESYSEILRRQEEERLKREAMKQTMWIMTKSICMTVGGIACTAIEIYQTADDLKNNVDSASASNVIKAVCVIIIAMHIAYQGVENILNKWNEPRVEFRRPTNPGNIANGLPTTNVAINIEMEKQKWIDLNTINADIYTKMGKAFSRNANNGELVQVINQIHTGMDFGFTSVALKLNEMKVEMQNLNTKVDKLDKKMDKILLHLEIEMSDDETDSTQ